MTEAMKLIIEILLAVSGVAIIGLGTNLMWQFKRSTNKIDINKTFILEKMDADERDILKKIDELDKRLADTRENYAHKDSINKIEEKLDILTNHIMSLMQKIAEMGGSMKSKIGK